MHKKLLGLDALCAVTDRSTSVRRLTRGWRPTILEAAILSARSVGTALVCTLRTAPSHSTVWTVTLYGVCYSVLAGFCRRLATRLVTGTTLCMNHVQKTWPQSWWTLSQIDDWCHGFQSTCSRVPLTLRTVKRLEYDNDMFWPRLQHVTDVSTEHTQSLLLRII